MNDTACTCPCLICRKPRLSVYHPGHMRGPCPTCTDEGWCVHRKATYYGLPEDFTIAGRRLAVERAKVRMAKLPRYYRPTVHRPGA